jgi:hypothetical protein
MVNEQYEMVKIELPKPALLAIRLAGLLRDNDYRVISVDVKDFDYSSSELWKAQKKAADKEYAKLKEIEFNIRNK